MLPFGLASKIRAHTGKPGPELLRLLAQAQEQFSGQPEEFSPPSARSPCVPVARHTGCRRSCMTWHPQA